MLDFDQPQIAADWATRGFSCDLWADPPGQRWEDFTHATDEVVIVLEGDMEFEVEGEVHHPQPGEELFIRPGRFTRRGTSTIRRLAGCMGIGAKRDATHPLDRPRCIPDSPPRRRGPRRHGNHAGD